MRKRKKDLSGMPGDMPEEVKLDIPYITIAGDRSVTVENYCGIISYESESVKINTRQAILKIEGGDLYLSCITDELISVAGQVKKVEFI